MNKNLKNLIKFLVSIFIVIFVLKKVNVGEVFEALGSLPLVILFLSLILTSLSLLLMSVKWKFFMDKLETHKLFYLYKIYWASDFMGLFNLGSLGSEAYKMISFQNKKKALVLSLVDKVYSALWYGISLLSIFLIYLLFGKFHVIEFFVFILFFYVVVIIYSFSEKKFLSSCFFREWRCFSKIRNFKGLTKKRLLKHATISLLFQGNIFLIYSVLLFYLGIEINFLLFAALTVITILTTLPISFQGLGVREYILLMYANFVGYNPELVISVSLLVFSITFIFRLFGVIPFLILKPKI